LFPDLSHWFQSHHVSKSLVPETLDPPDTSGLYGSQTLLVCFKTEDHTRIALRFAGSRHSWSDPIVPCPSGESNPDLPG
jgi:hypothetical protein